jgi:hypothetical protein
MCIQANGWITSAGPLCLNRWNPIKIGLIKSPFPATKPIWVPFGPKHRPMPLSLFSHLHPNLEQKNLLKYLWQAYVHPGKRVDYLGRPVVLKPVEPDQDWVDQIPVSRHEADLGAVRA